MKQRKTSRQQHQIHDPTSLVSAVDLEKPREEIEYTHFYPDLDPTELLDVYLYSSEGKKVCEFLNVRKEEEEEAKEKKKEKEKEKEKEQPSFTKDPGFRKILDQEEKEEKEEKEENREKKEQPNEPKQTIAQNYIRESPPSTSLTSLPSFVNDHFKSLKASYDLDEQDNHYLHTINRKRQRLDHTDVSADAFELAMTLLDTQWQQLKSRIPRPRTELSDECSICLKTDSTNQNRIVYCDNCEIAVHQECYGVVFIPESCWYCRPCLLNNRTDLHCVYCPSKNGAFKPTATGQWAHVTCGLWIPELVMKSSVYMETVDGHEKIPKSRWKLVCSICKVREGACVQCAHRSCFTAMHVTCAQTVGMQMDAPGGIPAVAGGNSQASVFCEKHGDPSSASYIRAQIAHLRGTQSSLKTLTNPAADHIQPVAPHCFFNDVVGILTELQIEAPDQVAQTFCRYWALKRTKHPLPLDDTSSEDTESRIKFNNILINDVHKLLTLSESVTKRQKTMVEQHNTAKKLLEIQQMPEKLAVAEAVDKINKLKGLNETQTASWNQILNNFNQGEYTTRLLKFAEDVEKSLKHVNGIEKVLQEITGQAAAIAEVVISTS